MTLLDHYLRAVRIYLPKGPARTDILNELEEHLRERFAEQEAELGRSLSEIDQEQVLAQFGDPLVVASRYGGRNFGLSFGRQLIGPELFPLYARILLAQFTCTFASISASWPGCARST
jgi:hypothetical protein